MMKKGKLELLSEDLRIQAESINALCEIYDGCITQEIPDDIDLSNRKAKMRQIRNKAQRLTFTIEKKLSEMRFLLNV